MNEFYIVYHKFSHDKIERILCSKHFWTCLIWQWYMQLVPFLFAAASSQMITEIAKYSIGRLRPHFIDLCKPIIKSSGIKIDRFSNCDSPYTYVEEYECSTVGTIPEKWLKDVHLSFMSGHSSFSSVCLIYLVYYIQNRFNWSFIGLIKHLMQAGLIFLVFYTGMSRISDYKHHW